MPPTTTGFQTPFGTFNLSRYPTRPDDPLLAWCAADTLLLEEAYCRDITGPGILVVNDTHGALCVALKPRALWTDSALAVIALRRNERTNGRSETPVIWSTEMPLSIPFIVVLRIPKKMLFFEYQLAQLARLLPEGATVLAAGMDKHLSPHSANILERIIGPTLRHPGQRKARLFSAVRDDRPATDANGIGTYYCEPLGAKLQGLPNVFSSEKLDLGTLFLLEHLRQLTPVETVFDLACGNGVLGLVAVKWGLTQKVVFCDESAMAIASTQLNANRIFPEKAHKFSFHHGDGLQGYRGKAAQLILCNPPFHLDHTVDEFAGRHLLEQCYIHLAPGGQLCLVANKHLNYQPALRRRFHRVENIANNAKFNILLAEKA